MGSVPYSPILGGCVKYIIAAQVGDLFGGCPYCKSGANWWERYRYPTNDDVVNRTIIRKLKGWETTAIWASEPYEAPKPKEESPPGLVPWEGFLPAIKREG